ncbi:hypothetical protein Ping_1963 [Psychromonas ingrahamii 37]|uniref:Lipoprotein n=1 Tax=Psychromonas ingrahamii (strain DSM 17664 / CCUG 51855 / 37) TaxID=357804 RepID=A1SW66_PSYIN|nr:hypothetical protein [Psychromonas ingrahamii]ABM03731.1 hypothetical protein Ping_1963 [Psychromonas ingrahamii 37]
MLKKSLLAVALASILTGCGTDTGTTGIGTSDGTNGTATTYTVIDGYLSYAEVSILLSDGITEKFIGDTGVNGKISIPAQDQDYTVIAKIIAGKTIDADNPGIPVAKSYEMRGTVDSNVVTPFTTLANTNVMTLTALAAELQLDEADVSGDYMNTPDGRARFVARGLAKKFDDDSSNDHDDADGLKTYANDSVSYIDTNFTDNDDLDEVELDDNSNDGNWSHHDRIAGVVDFIQTPSYLASFNQAQFNDEGILRASFSLTDNTVTLDQYVSGLVPQNSRTADYRIDENKIIINQGQGSDEDEFIYMANKFALAVTSEYDLLVWSKSDPKVQQTTAFTATELDGQTWHYVADDSTSKKPKIMNAALTFSAITGKVTINTHKNTDPVVDAPYSVDSNGKYSIDLPASITDGNGMTLTFSKMVGNEDMIIIMDNLGKPALLTADKKFADSIVHKWTDVAE